MTNTKQTILYSRLSREDERSNESLSIENQKAFLEDYANRHGFTNLVHLSDDGWSGTRWDRPGMTKLLDEVDKYALTNEAEFIERVRQESALQEKNAVRENKKKLTKSKRRRDEVTGLVRKLYESYAAGKIPESQFADLIKSYDDEQVHLDSEIARLQSEIDDFHIDSMGADRFMELVKKHMEFSAFTPVLLNEFIEKVIVHEGDKSSGKRIQKVDIYLNFIGNFDLPTLEVAEELPTRLSKGRKPRRLMTPEELEHEREIDHRAYAKKRAKRIAIEQAERDKILAGTSFEMLASSQNDSTKIAV